MDEISCQCSPAEANDQEKFGFKIHNLGAASHFYILDSDTASQAQIHAYYASKEECTVK